MARPCRIFRHLGWLLPIAVWSVVPFTAEGGSVESGAMPSTQAQLPAPLSTASDLTTLEGFAGAVGLFSSSGPDATHCLATLVTRNAVLTSIACGRAHDTGPTPMVYFPQAGPHRSFAMERWTYRLGVAIVTLNEDVPEDVVEKIPAMFLGGRLSKGRKSLERLDLEDAATFSFLDVPESLHTRFAFPLTSVGGFSLTEPFRFGTELGPADSLLKIAGAPLVVRDTVSGEYVVFGVHDDDQTDHGDGSSVRYWRSTWNPDIPDGDPRWQRADWILSKLGPDRDLDGRPDGLICEGENCDACLCTPDDIIRGNPCESL